MVYQFALFWGLCGRAAEQAYTQRGLVWRLRGEDERALEDFKSAARLGSRFAERQVRQLLIAIRSVGG